MRWLIVYSFLFVVSCFLFTGGVFAQTEKSPERAFSNLNSYLLPADLVKDIKATEQSLFDKFLNLIDTLWKFTPINTGLFISRTAVQHQAENPASSSAKDLISETYENAASRSGVLSDFLPDEVKKGPICETSKQTDQALYPPGIKIISRDCP